MRNSFPLFQSHLDLAHLYWKNIIYPGDCVLDATCGNGHDTLVLARLLLNSCSTDLTSTLHAIDVQQGALDATRSLLNSALPSSAMIHLKFHHRCHSLLPEEIPPDSLRLIVYNLGYLPGGNKQQTTSTTTTLNSLRAALLLLKKGGCISVTAYPGHPEGKNEEEKLLQFCATLPPQEWSACHHRFCNRKDSPSLFLIQHRIEEAKTP